MANQKHGFILKSKDLKDKTIDKTYGEGYRLVLKYDSDGRLFDARSTNDEKEYDAHLTIKHETPEASFYNSFGDVSEWKNGSEAYSASYGPYEQSGNERVDLDSFVMRCLIVMIGKNVNIGD